MTSQQLGFSIFQGPHYNEWENIFSYFGPPIVNSTSYATEITSKPVTSRSIFNLYGGNLSLNMIQQARFKDITSWQSIVASVREPDQMIEEAISLVFPPGYMEPAPENSVPKILTHRFEVRPPVALMRYHMSIKIKVDTLQTANGRAIALMQQKQLLQTVANTQKFLVTATIAGAESSLHTYLKKSPFDSIYAAQMREMQMSFIFNKNDRGLYDLYNSVKEFTKGDDPQFDALILNSGSLHEMVYSNDYETNASKIGDGVNRDRLINGKRSLAKALPGLEIFEDDAIEVQNHSTPEGGCLRRNILGGEWFFIDSSNYSPENDKNNDCNRDTSIQILDITKDTQSVITLLDAVENDVVWDAAGRPSVVLEEMIRDRASMFATNGMSIQGNKIDPFIYQIRSSSISRDRKLENDGYAVIKLWGNQQEDYRTLEQDINWGENAAKRSRNNMTDAIKTALEEGNALTTRLTNVSDIFSDQVQAFFFAVAANPENYSTGNEYAAGTGKQSMYLKPNIHGAAQLPRVDDALFRKLGKKVLYNLVNGKKHYIFQVQSSSQDRSANMLPSLDKDFAEKFRQKHPTIDVDGVQEVIAEAGAAPKIDEPDTIDTDDKAKFALKRYIIIKISSLFATLYKNNIAESKGWIQSDLQSLKASANYKKGGLDLDFGNPTDTDPFKVTSVLNTDEPNNEKLNIDVSNNVIFYDAYELAIYLIKQLSIEDNPLKTFSNIDGYADRNTALNSKKTEIDVAFESLRTKLSGVPLYSDSVNFTFSEAPAAPYGAGQMNYLRTLADYYRGDNRGWDQELLKAAFNFVNAFDEKIAKDVYKVSPECILLNSKYASPFMKTGNNAEDISNIIHFNYVERARGPIWVKIPQPLTAEGPFKGLVVSSSSMGDFLSSRAKTPINPSSIASNDTVKQQTITDVLNAMGFEINLPINRADKVKIKGLKEIENFTIGELYDYTLAIVTSKGLKQTLRETFKSSEDTKKLFNAYSSKNSNMGSSYASLNMQNDFVSDLFASFYLREIIPLVSLNRKENSKNVISSPVTIGRVVLRNANFYGVAVAANLLNLVCNMMATAINVSHKNDMTAELITSLKNVSIRIATNLDRNRIKEELELDEIEVNDTGAKAKIIEKNETIGEGYINTRMVIDLSQFEYLADNLDEDTIKKLMDLIIRPSDKRDISKPLGGFSVRSNKRVDVDSYKTGFSSFKNASMKTKITSIEKEPRTVLAKPWLYAAKSARIPPRSQVSELKNKGRNKNKEPQQRDSMDIDYTGAYDALSPEFSEDIETPLYEAVNYIDSTGNKIPDQSDIIEENNIKKRIKNIEDNCDDWLARLWSLSMLTSVVNKNSEITWIKNGLQPANRNYLIFRVVATASDSAIFIKKKQALEVLYKFPSTGCSIDAMREDLCLKVVAFLGCAVINPRNIFIQENVKIAKYYGGGGSTFHKDPRDFKQGNFINQRNSLISMRTGSVFNLSFAQYQNPISLYGKYIPDLLEQDIRDPHAQIFTNTQQWPSFFFYSKMFAFEDIKPSSYLRDARTFKDRKEIGDKGYFNGLLFSGSWNCYNKMTGKHDILVMGTSMYSNILPPCANIFRGLGGLFNPRQGSIVQ